MAYRERCRSTIQRLYRHIYMNPRCLQHSYRCLCYQRIKKLGEGIDEVKNTRSITGCGLAGPTVSPGTLAEVAPEADLKRDGIELSNDLPKTAASTSPKNEVWCGVPPAKPTLLAKNEINGRVKLH